MEVGRYSIEVFQTALHMMLILKISDVAALRNFILKGSQRLGKDILGINLHKLAYLVAITVKIALSINQLPIGALSLHVLLGNHFLVEQRFFTLTHILRF